MAKVILIASLIGLSGDAAKPTLTVWRHELMILVRPMDDPLAKANDMRWASWEDQSFPSPFIMEGLFTLYGYSETAYGVVEIRAAEYERTGHDPNGELWLRLRGEGIDGFRERLENEGFAGVVALKSDDVGRSGTASFWDDQRKVWTEPIRVLVLDSLGSGWDRLSQTWHPFEGHTPMPWIGDVSKDALEAVGLGRLVENNWSGFMRLLLDEAQHREVVWPDYG